MAAYHDLDNLDHDPKLAEALGQMVVAWARAETALVNIFACVTGIHANMAVMGCARIPTFEAKTKVVQALLTEWKPKKYSSAEIGSVVTKLNRLARARNDWVHGVWCHERELNETVVFDFRASEDAGRRKPVKAADVMNHVEAVRRRAAELLRLVPFPFDPDDH